jgi:hypothetical protein
MNYNQSGLDVGGFGSNPRHVVLVFGSLFAVVLGVIVGRQMSTEALAVVVGIVCGVAASIPTALLLAAVLIRRNQVGAEGLADGRRQSKQPPVVVVQGDFGTQGLPAGPEAGYWPAPVSDQAVERQWQVVGGEDLLLESGQY